MLKIENLKTVLKRNNENIPILDNINFELKKGEIIGLIGESGSGKTQTALSIINYLPKNISIEDGKILFNNTDLNHLSNRDLHIIRGNQISIIPQESLSSLNPLLSAGFQIRETIVSHKKYNKRESEKITKSLLKKVGFSDPDNIYTKYPHELSGGMRQRILIAIAISCDPEILIADEPTSSLDTNSESEIVDLLKAINLDRQMSIIFITHNINLTKDFCDRIIVMYHSRIVESGITAEILENPKHEYTKELLSFS